MTGIKGQSVDINGAQIAGAESSADTDFSKALRSNRSFEISFHSFRDAIGTIPSDDLGQIKALLEEDPALENLRERVLQEHPGVADISKELAALVAFEINSSLSSQSHEAVKTVVDFYFGYLRPFPDITETEPLSSLLGYLDDLPTWNVRQAKNAEGNTIGACSGQIVDVKTSLGDHKFGWNEHTWVDKESRKSGVARNLVDLFSDDVLDARGKAVVIENDNPYLITKDPRAFNHADPVARAHFWTDPVDGLGQSMDPFQRFVFWGKQGFGIMCAGEPLTPLPYTQISMDLGKVGSCETIGLAVQILDAEFEAGIPKEVCKELFLALQRTIDSRAEYYPEVVRTLQQIDDIKSDTVHFIRLDDPRLYEVLQRAVPLKENYVDKDLAYCTKRLQMRGISEDEREILLKSQAYLSGKAA